MLFMGRTSEGIRNDDDDEIHLAIRAVHLYHKMVLAREGDTGVERDTHARTHARTHAQHSTAQHEGEGEGEEDGGQQALCAIDAGFYVTRLLCRSHFENRMARSTIHKAMEAQM